jgi:uncharacterized lipoprotein YbaY
MGWVAAAAAVAGAVGTAAMTSKPKAPTPVPDAPNMNSAANGVNQNELAENERRRRAGVGRGSTVLTGLGDAGYNDAPSAKKSLLGG